MQGEQYDIDNDDNFLAFDPCDMEGLAAYASSSFSAFDTANSSSTGMSSQDGHSLLASGRQDGHQVVPPNARDKGKGASMPMPIRPSITIRDLFDISPSNEPLTRASSSFSPSDFSSFSPSSSAFSPAASSSSSYGTSLSPPASITESIDAADDPSMTHGGSGAGKGKARELPPVLPPLRFYYPETDDHHLAWASLEDSTPSSSYSPAQSSSASEAPLDSPSNANADASPSSPTDSPSTHPLPTNATSSSHNLTRCKSLSNLSVASDTTLRKVKQPVPHRAQSYLARKLAFGKQSTPTPSRPGSPAGITAELLRYDLLSPSGKNRRVWYATPKLDEATILVSRPSPPVPVLTLESAVPRPSSCGLLKHKGRSQSEPLPFSILDFVPISSTDIFEPLPLFIKNYFDDTIPREIHIHILRCFVQIHMDDHRRAIESGRWSVNRASASRNQWVGKDKGVRELIKLSRVSRSWRTAVYDGELWVDLDLHGLPKLPQHIVHRITQSGGSFVQTLNVAGHVHLKPENFIDIADCLCLAVPTANLPYTQLTAINLQGCVNLTTRSLHHLLIRSRALEKLILKGLGAVTNTTCEVLATYCPNVVSLDLSQCPNMDANGIRFMANAALARKEHLQLKELRLCALKHISDSMMQSLGRAAPFLEVLDLSYARQLHNSALEAFVACDDEDTNDHSWTNVRIHTVTVSARELGRNANDFGQYRRRITRLRHLNLSFCLLLTDVACSNLAYSVPRLEFLELAGIGSDLKDAGLIRLLERTPFIRRLDLEDAMDLTDAFLAAITPAPASPALQSAAVEANPPQPGHALEFLTISYSMQLTDQALIALIRNCPKLTRLEADNTRIGPTVLREFVRLSKERQSRNAKIGAVDCRAIGESIVKELSGSTRPRLGWRAYAAKRLHYLDGRDGNEEDLKVGGDQDECDESRIVLKTFYSWQTVDAVKANREKRRKSTSRRAVNGSLGVEDEDGDRSSRAGTRWWSPGGRRSGRSSPPTMTDIPNEGCRTM